MDKTIRWKELTPTQRDRLVSEKIFGIREYELWPRGKDGPSVIYRKDADDNLVDDPIPPYTTSMDAAWQVVKRFTVSVELIYTPGRDTYCKIQPPIGEPVYGIAENPAEAICIAALRSVLRPVGIEVLYE